MTTADVVFVGTEVFWDDYSKQSPTNKINYLANYCENMWSGEIDSGSYDLATSVEDGSGRTEIPESALPDNQPSLYDRLKSADNYLESNLSGYYGIDSIIIADYYVNNAYGWALGANATQSINKSAVADCGWEDNSSLPPAYSNTKSEGIAWHELLHLWRADHTYGITYADGDATIMWDWNQTPDCTDNGTGSLKLRDVSSCNKDRVRSYYDDNRYYIG